MHIIIVGAGPGGLGAAINLAGLGLKVTLVEKDTLPGGRMKGLTLGERGEYALDSGPTIFQFPVVLEKIFERAGKRLSDYVTLMPVEPINRTWFWDGTHLDTWRDEAKMAAEVAKYGPDKAAQLKAWMSKSREKFRFVYEKFVTHPADSLSYFTPWLNAFNLRFKPWQSLYQHLDEHFHDDHITYGFAFPSKYLGLHPNTASSLFSIVPFLEQTFGVWHPKGGFRALARGMMRCAQDLGAEFRMGTPVSRIWVEDGQARGVELASGERLASDAVVVNADLPYAAKSLLDPRWRRKEARLSDEGLEKTSYSCSTLVMYLGLDRVYEDIPHHVIYLPEYSRRTDREAVEDLKPELEDPPMYVCNPCVMDPSGAPAGHSTLYAAVPTPHTGRPVDFEHIDRVMTERLPGWLAKVGIKDVARHIRAQRVYTARTWRDDFNVFRGAVFSLAHNLGQLGPMRPKVRSPDVRGLYWVGGGTHPGSGLLPILESSNIAADYLSRATGKGPLRGWPYVPPLERPGSEQSR